MVVVHLMKDVVVAVVVYHDHVNQSRSNWVISFDAADVVVVEFVVEVDVEHSVNPCIDPRMICGAKYKKSAVMPRCQYPT